MASIRKLKKEINRTSFELINECFNFRYLNPEKTVKIDEVIRDLIRMRNDLVSRSNHSEPANSGKELRDHYHRIREDLTRLTELTKQE
jgi:hypothetical protein